MAGDGGGGGMGAREFYGSYSMNEGGINGLNAVYSVVRDSRKNECDCLDFGGV